MSLVAISSRVFSFSIEHRTVKMNPQAQLLTLPSWLLNRLRHFSAVLYMYAQFRFVTDWLTVIYFLFTVEFEMSYNQLYRGVSFNKGDITASWMKKR